MRALFYTMILSAILVVAVIYLRSIPPREPAITETLDTDSTISLDAELRSMAVHSQPATLSNIDPNELESVTHDALYETGVELLDLWHLPEAIDVFQTLVSNDPGNLDAHLRLVECYSHPMVGAERKAEASWVLASDLAISTRADTTWVNAFRSLFLDYMPVKAIVGLTEIVNRGEGNLDARLLLARSLLMNGDLEGAERYLGVLLDGDVSLGRARELLIQSKIARGDVDGAENLAKDLVALYPEEPYPHVLLARIKLIQGRLDEATGLCNNALLLDKRYIPAIVSRAHIYVAAGDADAARVSFEKLVMFDDPMLASVAAEGIAYVDFLFGNFHAASESMDDAIRFAMGAESRRRGMLYAFRFVDYLCELGRVDAAERVLDRWLSRYTEIPTELGELRILISQGNLDEARSMLAQLEVDERWQSWMRSLSLDQSELEALALIHEKDFKRALTVLGARAPEPGGTRSAYLTGYALFQNGDAEGAVDSFRRTQSLIYGVVFPYHNDPILYVQSIFFLGEAALARGESEQAQAYYRDFLNHWGNADWDLKAVDRARAKLETLSLRPSDD